MQFPSRTTHHKGVDPMDPQVLSIVEKPENSDVAMVASSCESDCEDNCDSCDNAQPGCDCYGGSCDDK